MCVVEEYFLNFLQRGEFFAGFIPPLAAAIVFAGIDLFNRVSYIFGYSASDFGAVDFGLSFGVFVWYFWGVLFFCLGRIWFGVLFVLGVMFLFVWCRGCFLVHWVWLSEFPFQVTDAICI